MAWFPTRTLKRNALGLYTYAAAERLRFDAVGGRIESWLARPGTGLTEFRDWRGEAPRDADFLIATSARGLLLLRGGKIYRLPTAKYVYGVARGAAEEWYFAESWRLHGRIRRISFAGPSLSTNELLYWGLPTRVHQIEYRLGRLLLADTYHNRISVLDAQPHDCGTYWRRNAQCFYPAGRLGRGRLSPNYSHLNSIALRDDGTIALLAHNETTKTGKHSELLTLDADMKLLARTDTGSSNAHNIYFDAEGNVLTCDSAAGAVRLGTRTFEIGPFPRGLSVSMDYVAVGCSPVCARREKRDDDGAAEILFADLGRGRCSTVVLAGTQVHEIRRLDRKDFAMGLQTPHAGIVDALEALSAHRRTAGMVAR